MAQFKYGDLREPALPRYVIDAEGNVLGGVAFPMNVTGDVGITGTVDVEVSDEPVQVVDTWTPLLIPDETADDSDKSFTVPANYMYQVLWIWVELTTTATVGNRQMTIELQDSAADVIGRWKAGAVQAASLTRNYCFAPSNADLTAFRDTSFLMTPFPPTVVLPAGYIIRVYDSGAVAAAADDMVVQLMVARRAV